MPGPPPDPNARRRNKRHAGFEVLPEQGRPDAVVPELPPDCHGQPWEPAVLDAWTAWWRSPMSTQYLEADVATLTLEAQHLQASLSGDLERAREYRLLADRFGLSPLARLRNRWLVGDEGEAGTSATTADVVPLRAVGDDE